MDLGKGVSLGQLWLELLRFYTLEFALEEYIISIRLKELLTREVKNWPRRRLAIEGERPLCWNTHLTPLSHWTKNKNIWLLSFVGKVTIGIQMTPQ